MEDNFKPHAYDWAVDRLRQQPSYLERNMFGCRACYFQGELKIVLADQGEEPWSGILVATSRERHQALVSEFPDLTPHPVLGKWLYLPQNFEKFEQVATAIERAILKGDGRIGVLPSPRGPRKKAKRPSSTK